MNNLTGQLDKTTEVDFLLQIVRRKAATLSSEAMPVISDKERRLEFALVSLASTNLFVIFSAAAFYFLVHNG